MSLAPDSYLDFKGMPTVVSKPAYIDWNEFIVGVPSSPRFEWNDIVRHSGLISMLKFKDVLEVKDRDKLIELSFSSMEDIKFLSNKPLYHGKGGMLYKLKPVQLDVEKLYTAKDGSAVGYDEFLFAGHGLNTEALQCIPALRRSGCEFRDGGEDVIKALEGRLLETPPKLPISTQDEEKMIQRNSAKVLLELHKVATNMPNLLAKYTLSLKDWGVQNSVFTPNIIDEFIQFAIKTNNKISKRQAPLMGALDAYMTHGKDRYGEIGGNFSNHQSPTHIVTRAEVVNDRELLLGAMVYRTLQNNMDFQTNATARLIDETALEDLMAVQPVSKRMVELDGTLSIDLGSREAARIIKSSKQVELF